LVTAATVAVMGIVGFVGLMVPHIVRLLVGPDHRRLLPLSFITGALFLMWADVACRVLPLADLKLGVLTAVTGGPFFLFLLIRHRRTLGTL
jgi:iron complex transport system permease protein